MMAKSRQGKPKGGRPPGRRGKGGIGPGPGYRPGGGSGGTTHGSRPMCSLAVLAISLALFCAPMLGWLA